MLFRPTPSHLILFILVGDVAQLTPAMLAIANLSYAFTSHKVRCGVAAERWQCEDLILIACYSKTYF